MRGTQPINRTTKTSIFPALFVWLSLLLNVLLVAYLLNRKSATLTAAKTADDPKPARTQSPSAVLATFETPTIAEPVVSEFHWSEIESADYRQYIANLRALGVPEPLIRDIIVTDVNQLHTKRAREIWQPRVTAYWQKYANERPDPKQLDQLMALGKEQGALLQDLLGTRIGRQELIDLLYLQVHGSERQLLFLPLERREAAMQVLAEADFESKETKLHSEGSYSTKDEQKLFDEKLESLSAVLSPEELEEFHRRNSPAGSILKSEIRYFKLTPEEYQQLLFAREADGGKQNTRDIVRKLFGDERAKEFEGVSSSFYQNARTGAEAEGIPLARVDEAAKFANASMAAGLATAQDRTLSVEERKARLKELQAQAESKIKGLLGDKASQTVLRDLRNVLRSSASHIQP